MSATLIYREKTIAGASGATGATGAPTKGSPLTNLEIDANFYNLTTEVDTKLGATGYNAADVLTKIKTVDGAGSGLDADTVDGLNPTTGWTGASGATGFTPSNIVARDALGNFTAGTITANLVGSVTGDISGNAGTVTNGVVTSGSYANPAWITSLAGSKVSSIPNTSLTNSTITINGNGVALGGSVSLFGTDGTWTGTQTFYDNKFVIVDNVDTSKKLNLQLSNIANATTRTLSAPNEDGVIATQAYVTSSVSTATSPLQSSVDSLTTAVALRATTTYVNSSVGAVQTQVDALTKAKGFISFYPPSGGVYASKNLTLVRNGTGAYTVYLDSSIQNGTVNYAPLVGAVSKGQTYARGFGPGIAGTSAIDEGLGFAVDVYGVCIQSVSASSFVVKSNRNYTAGLVGAGGNDWNLANSFAADLFDPDRITVVVF